MAWRRPGNKPLSRPMTVSLMTHICVTRPQWFNLKHDCKNGIHWFTDNGMKANPNKFQSSKPLEAQNIELYSGARITSELNVKILGVVRDDRSNFDEHISMCCTKAARQLNAFARIARYLAFKSKTNIDNSFVLSNFNYCPLAGHPWWNK